MDSIGSRIKTAREKSGISQEQLGKMCNTTKQTIFKYESGIVTNIPMDRIETIARALCVDPCYLMGWERCQRATPTPPPANDLTPDEADLVHKYRALDYGGKLRIRSALDVEYSLRPGRTDDRVLQQA